MKFFSRLILAGCVSALYAPVDAAAQTAPGPSFTFTQLEPAGDPARPQYPVSRTASATGINNQNQIVGHDNGFNGVFYSASGGIVGAFRALGATFAGPPIVTLFATVTVTSKINDLGTVVGWKKENNSFPPQGFVMSAGGAFTAITAPSGEFADLVEGLAINNQGDLVGVSTSDGRSWVVSGGTATMVNLPVTGVSSVTNVADNNDLGHRVGRYLWADGLRHGYYQTGPTMADVTNIDHPLAAPGQTYPTGLNNRGEVVGWYTTSAFSAAGSLHGFLWKAGVFTPIDYVGLNPQGFIGRDTVPNDINDAGWVVGQTSEWTTDGGVGGHAWLAMPDSPVVSLTAPSIVVTADPTGAAVSITVSATLGTLTCTADGAPFTSGGTLAVGIHTIVCTSFVSPTQPTGQATAQVAVVLAGGEFSHRLPHVLPGGKAVIFTISKGAQRWADTQVVVRSLETGQQTVLIEGGADGRYVPTGHLVYVRLGTLMAAPFDPDRLAVTGGATGLVDNVMQAANRNLSDMANTLAGQFTVSDTGALVYLTGGALPGAERVLAWVDRKGRGQTLGTPPRSYSKPRLSPDGRYISVSTHQDVRDVWRYDVARGALNPITVDGQSGYSVFVPDGKRVVFRSGAAGGEDNLYWKAADGSGGAERLTTSRRSQTPASWSPDGTTLAYVEEGPSAGFFQFDIWGLSMADRKIRPIVQTPANEMSPEFSPDGNWLAYVSNESGRNEVYAQPYPGPGERHLISNNGGEQPAWGADGRELFYVQRDYGSRLQKLLAVRISTAPEFEAGVPHTVFEHADLVSPWGRSYDVSPDGHRFLIALTKDRPADLAPTQMIFVQNWFDELKRLVPRR